jgi:hypothetical protein
MNLLHLFRHFAKHTIEYLVRQIHRLLDRLSGGHNSHVYLSFLGKPDLCDETGAQTDHSSVDPRHVRVGVEHQIAPRTLSDVHEPIDTSEEYFRWQVTTLLTTQRALDDDQLKWKFADTGRNVPAAFLACDNEHLAS